MKKNKGIVFLIGIICILILEKKEVKNKLNKIQQLSDKHLDLFFMMNQWVKVKQDGKDISNYLIENGYRRIAIYGMSYVGKTLLRELKGTDVEIVCFIDRNADRIYSDIKIISDVSFMSNVDAVVVTAINSYSEIKRNLCKKILLPIISLEDILDNM